MHRRATFRARALGVPDHGPSLLPAAAQRLVQSDPIRLLGEPRHDQCLLRQVERALRLEQHQVAVAARFVTREREPVCLGCRIDRRLQRGALFGQGRSQRERVRDVAKALPGWPARTAPVRCRGRRGSTSRFARRRPPSKIGRFTWGANTQTLVPASNRPDNSSLAEPTEPVSLIDGKKAARAAPMFALSARN